MDETNEGLRFRGVGMIDDVVRLDDKGFVKKKVWHRGGKVSKAVSLKTDLSDYRDLFCHDRGNR